MSIRDLKSNANIAIAMSAVAIATAASAQSSPVADLNLSTTSSYLVTITPSAATTVTVKSQFSELAGSGFFDEALAQNLGNTITDLAGNELVFPLAISTATNILVNVVNPPNSDGTTDKPLVRYNRIDVTEDGGGIEDLVVDAWLVQTPLRYVAAE